MEIGKVVAQYPNTVWDGLSTTRDSRETDAAPDFNDWDAAVAEILATQTEVDANAAAGAASDDDLTVPNGSGGAIVVGTSVYMLANGTGADKADANGTAPARNVCGLVQTGQGGSGGTVVVRQEGDLTLTTTQWDAIAGTTGGLTAYTEYYLSATPGELTATAPNTTGDNVVVVGIAKSTTVMNIRIRHSRISA